MRWLSRLVTIALLGGLVVGSVLIVRARIARRQMGASFYTYGQFRDASRLPVGSRVMIAGVHVGEISGLSIDGRLARVSMRLRDDVQLWDDAWAEKKVASAFGDGYVEVHPGGAGPGRRLLESGEPLGHVFEGVSIDRVLRELDQALPRGQNAVRAAQAQLATARRVVSGRTAAQLAWLDQALKDGSIEAPFHAANDAMDRLEAWTEDAADATGGLAARIDGTLDTLEGDTATASAQLREGQQAVRDGMATARTKIDELDPYLEAAGDTIAELGGGARRDDAGLLATLIDDPALGDTIADTAERGRELTHGVTQLKTALGLRTEFNILSGEPRFYVTAEITGHNDAFYLIEAQKSAQGDVPDVRLTEQPGMPGFLRTATILEGLRITAQWGKRRDWADVRFGLKESTFGVGGDVIFLGGRLRASVDLFGPSFSQVPRLKLAAALEVFHGVYVLAGIDDALRPGGTVPIEPWPTSQDVPTQFRELRYGRDAFLGFELRFRDEDLNTLLALYGAALISAL